MVVQKSNLWVHILPLRLIRLARTLSLAQVIIDNANLYVSSLHVENLGTCAFLEAYGSQVHNRSLDRKLNI